MSGFASIDIPAVSLSRSPASIGVYRYFPGSVARFEYLPNIRVLSIQSREGPDPGIARFRYVFDQKSSPFDTPLHFEQALAVGNTLAGVVQNDERLVVATFNPDGSPLFLFDGFAQVPELQLSEHRELVTFSAFGSAVREWDLPIGGALMRNANDPESPEDVETDVLTQFNPGGLPNATPEDADASDSHGNRFPTFLDPLVIRDPDARRKWTLPMAVRYLCYRHNSTQAYVANPDGGLIDRLLNSRMPRNGVTIDPSVPETYLGESLHVSDLPLTGKPWPVALWELLEPHGFRFAFRLETVGGRPRTRLELFRSQDGSPSGYKDLYLQEYGSQLDPALTNLGQARLARDMSGVANAYVVESELVRYEASFVLAPGFSISPGDATSYSTLAKYSRNAAEFSETHHDDYRLYLFDETGEGHWDWESSSISREPPSLEALFGASDGKPTYVTRRRPALGELFSLDPTRKPLKARLSISTDYAGVQPGLWDGTGTWQTVNGGYELLRDRLGIYINTPNPNGWNIQPSIEPDAPFPAGIVRGVEDQAKPGGARFALRLTCVVEGDRVLPAKANRRPSSPTQFEILRRVDARDRLFKHVIAARSEFNSTDREVAARDDTSDAMAEAAARRLTGEAGEVAGSVTIPRFSYAYRIGDKIRSIRGRDLSLRTNAGAPGEEGETFPSVVGLSWTFDGRQETVLNLSDQRGDL